MKEGRKFGMSVIVASQGMGDFHPDVLSNAGTKVIFRMITLNRARFPASFVGVKDRTSLNVSSNLLSALPTSRRRK